MNDLPREDKWKKRLSVLEDKMKDMLIIHKDIIQYLEDNNFQISTILNDLTLFNITKDKKRFENFLYFIDALMNAQIKNEKIKKIINILSLIKNEIKNNFSKEEIFIIFQLDSPVLLFLYENDLIDTETIIAKYECINDFIFFFPEISEKDDFFLDDTSEENHLRYFFEIHKNNAEEFKEKRKEFHSDNYLSKLIREDNVDMFIGFIAQQAEIDIKTYRITGSIYESNYEINVRYQEMLSYAAAFGSLNIFKYLFLNNVVIPENLASAAVIGGNYNIIHIVEEEFKNICFDTTCLREAIKYHHNEIAEYLNETIGIEIDDACIISGIQAKNYVFIDTLLGKKTKSFVESKKLLKMAIKKL